MTKNMGIRRPVGQAGGYPPSTEPKACSACKEVKPADQFKPYPQNRSGLSSQCRACIKAHDRSRPRRYSDRREWWHSKERMRRYQLKRQFGITLEEFVAMREAQRGLCAICGQPETAISVRWGRKTQSLAVDHDHETGEIRGLLCDRCNRVLGWAQDQPALLERAAAYLRTPREVRITAS